MSKKYQEKLIRQLAKKYNKDPRVIKQIVYSPIKFANRIVSDILDDRPIRIRYFGVFALKHPEAKINLLKDHVASLKKHMVESMVIMSSMGYQIKDSSSVERILDEAIESKDFEKVQQIWDEYMLGLKTGKRYKDTKDEVIRHRKRPTSFESDEFMDTGIQEVVDERQDTK